MSKEKNTGGAPRNLLNMIQKAKLLSLIGDNYPNSGLNDEECAKRASEQLGFSVSASNVHGARAALGIPSEFKRIAAVKAADAAARKAARAAKASSASLAASAADDRVTLLEVKVARLEKALKDLMADLGVIKEAA